MATITQSGIYSIAHISGKRYIGSSADIKRRERQHFRALCGKRHINSHLQSAWNKYGADEFSFSILLLCDKKDLLFYEQRAIDVYKAFGDGGFNKSPSASGSIGRKMTEAQKASLSARMKGRKLSDATRAAISKSCIGRRHTEESKEKIRQHHIGLHLTPEAKAKISAAKTGLKHSEDTKKKMRVAHIGNQHNKGRKHSPETKAKVAAAVTAVWAARKQGELSSQP